MLNCLMISVRSLAYRSASHFKMFTAFVSVSLMASNKRVGSACRKPMAYFIFSLVLSIISLNSRKMLFVSILFVVLSCCLLFNFDIAKVSTFVHDIKFSVLINLKRKNFFRLCKKHAKMPPFKIGFGYANSVPNLFL